MKVVSDSNYIIGKVGTHKAQRVHKMRLRLFKPDYNIDNISVSKQVYPDNESIEETDIFDSNTPRTKEADQDEETKLDSASEEIVARRLQLPRGSALYSTPRVLTGTSISEIEIDFDDLRSTRVHFKSQEEKIPPTIHDENRMNYHLEPSRLKKISSDRSGSRRWN